MLRLNWLNPKESLNVCLKDKLIAYYIFCWQNSVLENPMGGGAFGSLFLFRNSVGAVHNARELFGAVLERERSLWFITNLVSYRILSESYFTPHILYQCCLVWCAKSYILPLKYFGVIVRK